MTSPANASLETATGIVYGLVVEMEKETQDEGSDKTSAVALSQGILDRYLLKEKVEHERSMVKDMEGSGMTIKRKVLTYFSQNTIEKDALEDTEKDGIVDPLPSSGKWIGVARLAMTPLALGYATINAMDEGTTFPTTVPMKVRLVSASFSVKTVKLDLTKTPIPQGTKYIGPVRESTYGIPCTVAYIPPDQVKTAAQVQDLGDSYIIEKRTEKTLTSDRNGWSFRICHPALVWLPVTPPMSLVNG